MNTQELIDRYQAGDRDFRWSDLTRADLSEIDLQGINLSGSDMTWAKLNGASLKQANLEMVDMSMADLRDADLTGADLRGVYLRWARLDGAILEQVNLEGAIVNDLKLARARSLAGAILPNGQAHQEPDRPLLTAGSAPDSAAKSPLSSALVEDLRLATRALYAPPEVLDRLLSAQAPPSNGPGGDRLGTRSLERFRPDNGETQAG